MRLDKANSQSSDLYLDIQSTISVGVPAYLILIHNITLLYASFLFQYLMVDVQKCQLPLFPPYCWHISW